MVLGGVQSAAQAVMDYFHLFEPLGANWTDYSSSGVAPTQVTSGVVLYEDYRTSGNEIWPEDL
jgi:hypothetical protein